MLSFKPTFSLSSFTFIKRRFSSSLLCYKTGVICVSEVIDISPGNLDSSLCFIQPSISHECFPRTLLLFFFQGYQLCNFEQVLSLDYLICKIKGLDILSKVHLEANMYSEFKAVQSSIRCTLARVLVSQGCCNSIPKLGGLRKTDFITILGPIHLKSRCRGPCSLWTLG